MLLRWVGRGPGARFREIYALSAKATIQYQMKATSIEAKGEPEKGKEVAASAAVLPPGSGGGYPPAPWKVLHRFMSPDSMPA